MIPQFMLELGSFVTAAIFCVLPFMEEREVPPSHRAPAISAARDHRPQPRFIAIVEPGAALQLIKVARAKRQNDADAFAGGRPAWEMLVLAICVFAYLYLYDLSRTVTVIGSLTSIECKI